jgi:MFS family permease
MKQAGLALALFGIVWACFNFFAIAGSKFAYKLEELLGEKRSLYFIALSVILSTFFMGSYFGIFGIGLIFLQQFIRGFNSPVLEAYTHKHLDSHNRATLMSIQGMVASLLFFIFGPLFGWIADKFSLGISLQLTGLGALIAFSALFIRRAQNAKDRNTIKVKNHK